MVCELLARYAADERVLDARMMVAALARSSSFGRTGSGRDWSREESSEDRGR